MAITSANTLYGIDVGAAGTVYLSEAATPASSSVNSYSAGCTTDACSNQIIANPFAIYQHIRLAVNSTLVASTSNAALAGRPAKRRPAG